MLGRGHSNSQEGKAPAIIFRASPHSRRLSETTCWLSALANSLRPPLRSLCSGGSTATSGLVEVVVVVAAAADAIAEVKTM